MPRLEPLTDQHIDDAAILERFAHYARTRGFTPNSIRTMARRPAIVKAFMALNQAVLYEGTVPTALKMLVATATSLAAGCRYCQSHMTNLSAIYDAGDLRIAALWDFEHADCFSPAERAALVVAFRAGMTPNGVEDADLGHLREHFDDDQVVEIIATIALFGFLNRWNDTLATALENHPHAVAERILGATGWDAGKHGEPCA